MPSYKTEAINLRSRRFSEADKLLSIFTRERGKVSVIAKSACKPTSKFGGRLEVFGYNNLFLAAGKNLDILSQAETIESFHVVREKESSLDAGLYITRVLFYFLEEKVPRERLFDLLLGCLRLLKEGADPTSITRLFDVQLADIEGFLPVERFSSDMQCRIAGVKIGSDAPNFSKEEIRNIDLVLIPGISEHVGKDVSLWKNI